MTDAPRSVDFLGEEAQAHWDELLGHMDDLGVPYKLDNALVRGLDYYTRTVFEIHPGHEGAQSAVCAGGRYDGLIEQLGGKPTPGIGFAAGLERIIMNLREQRADIGLASPSPVVITHNGVQAKARAIAIATSLRNAEIPAVVAPVRSMKAQMRYASALGASKVVLIGPREMERGVVTVRDMVTAKQNEELENGLIGSLGS